jgi:membrane-associated phospholipid phosphatase
MAAAVCWIGDEAVIHQQKYAEVLFLQQPGRIHMVRLVVIALVSSLIGGAASAQSPQPSDVSAETVASRDAESQQATQPSPAVDRLSVRSLVRDLGRNFRDLPSLETATILGVGGGLAAWVHSEDAEITQQWAGSARLDGIFEPGAVMGSGWVQIGGAFGLYIVGRATDRPRLGLLGADLMRSQVINTVLTQGLKIAVNRQRPDGASYSFPSGHASATFATATVVQRNFGWKVGIPAYAVATFVGSSRLQENRHYLSDVLFGAAVGIVSGRAATIGRGRSTFAIAPLATRGGIGVTFTHVPAER